MSEIRIGFGDDEPSAEHTAIVVADIKERLPRLEKKLAEYKQRNESDGVGYIHPELLALQRGLLDVFKPAVLESVIELATVKQPNENVYLHEVTVLVQDKTGFNVARAATIPFRYSESYKAYLPDRGRLLAEAGQTGLEFSEAYGIIRAYCTDRESRLVIGGTGLPEA